MQKFGATGLALSSSLSGFVLLILTIKAFGYSKFKNIINSKKLLIILILVLMFETLILYFLKYLFDFGGFYGGYKIF